MIDEILSKYINNEKASSHFSGYSLDGIRTLLDRMGNPHKKLKLIHVAGTNGKGSTCHMIHAIFSSNGYCTGLYTSPHLERITERIIVDSKEIPESELYGIIAEIDSYACKDPSLFVSWFDIMTTAAFIYFTQKKVDIAVIETGLGGKLDSTNVITPLVSVLTDISLDHCHILGDTVEKIAMDKAGIIKRSVPVVTSNSGSTLDILKQTSTESESRIYSFNDDFFAQNILPSNNGIQFDFTSSLESIDTITLPQPGAFQAKNGSLAIMSALLCRNYGFSIDPSLIRKALSGSVIPGRMEILSKDPFILFDPAHNLQAMESLAEMVSHFRQERNVTVFVSIMKDKTPQIILEYIRKRISSEIYYCTLDDDRAYIPSDSDQITKIVPFYNHPEIHLIIETHKTDLILFTGSFRIYHIAGEAARKHGI